MSYSPHVILNLTNEQLEAIQDSSAHNFSSYSMGNMVLLNLDENKHKCSLVRDGGSGWIAVVCSSDLETVKNAVQYDFYVFTTISHELLIESGIKTSSNADRIITTDSIEALIKDKQ